jgi:phospholipid/cholesterol/gamma-HCH transport system substrate-binding protein
MNAVRRRRFGPAVAALVLGTLAFVLPACSGGPSGGPEVTADFKRGTGLYPGSPVRVLGINIGKVTRVRNVDGRVRVGILLNRGTKLPADARATIVPLTLLGERYIQMGPAWTDGPTLADGDRIPLARTSVPAEIDELLRGLQDFMGAIDPKRAGSVVTRLATLFDGRGAELNDLLGNAAGTLDLLADKGDDLKAIIASLKDLSATLKGRTDSIDSLVRNYDLVTQVLIDNKGDLDGMVTQLDRATVELSKLLTEHQDPLREDVRVLTATGRTLAANTDNIKITLKSTVRLFEAAGRAYEQETNALRVNNQSSPELTSALVSGRLRDRIAGLCRRLKIAACSDPASPLLNGVAGLLPGIIAGLDKAQSSGSPPKPPASSAPAPPAAPTVQIPTDAQLLTALADQLTNGLTDPQRTLLDSLDGPRLAALLALDPTLLQILPKLDEAQVARLRDADVADIGALMLQLFNEVRPPSTRLTPLLPGSTPTTTPTRGGGIGSWLDPLTGTLGG